MTRRYSLRQIDREVQQLKVNDTDEERVSTAEITVEWRESAPDERPEGMAWNPDDGTLTYDAWNAQRETLEALAVGEADIVACLAGYGAGKSITGARWLIE